MMLFFNVKNTSKNLFYISRNNSIKIKPVQVSETFKTGQNNDY